METLKPCGAMNNGGCDERQLRGDSQIRDDAVQTIGSWRAEETMKLCHSQDKSIYGSKHPFKGLGWIGLDWSGLYWIGVGWIEVDWIGLDWTGLDCLRGLLRQLSAAVCGD
ncbi:hypothetical protein STEG23_011101 [Scotinomys teguina]